jgi:hypothetical protein
MRRLFLAIAFATLATIASRAVAQPREEIRVTLLGTGTPILNINRFAMSTLVEDFRSVVSAMRRREFITLLGGSTAIRPRRACGASSATVDGPK